MKTVVLLVLVLVGCAAPLLILPSGLEKARWGMKEDEVVAAFRGQAKRPSANQHSDLGFTIPQLSIDSFDFAGKQCAVRFIFNGPKRGLGTVELRPKDPGTASAAQSAFQHLESILMARYGAPAVSDRDSRIWRFPDAHVDLRKEDWGALFFVALTYEDPVLEKMKL